MRGTDKHTCSASRLAPDPRQEGRDEGAASAGAGRAKENGDAGVFDAEVFDGGVFTPSAAAIEEAKSAARKSGGLSLRVPACTLVYAVSSGFLLNHLTVNEFAPCTGRGLPWASRRA